MTTSREGLQSPENAIIDPISGRKVSTSKAEHILIVDEKSSTDPNFQDKRSPLVHPLTHEMLEVIVKKKPWQNGYYTKEGIENAQQEWGQVLRNPKLEEVEAARTSFEEMASLAGDDPELAAEVNRALKEIIPALEKIVSEHESEQ